AAKVKKTSCSGMFCGGMCKDSSSQSAAWRVIAGSASSVKWLTRLMTYSRRAEASQKSPNRFGGGELGEMVDSADDVQPAGRAVPEIAKRLARGLHRSARGASQGFQTFGRG